MTAPTKLGIYNNALLVIGIEKLASLAVNEKARRVLDQIWDANFPRRCLEKGYWNFAMRTVRIEYDPDVDPEFGYPRAFEKPSDWVRTAAISPNDRFDPPLKQYADEAGYWWSDLDTMYVKYVSDDAAYGLDMSKWPESFVEWMETNLGMRAMKLLTEASADLEQVKKDEKRLLTVAKSKDAMNEAVSFTPRGRWTAARHGMSGASRSGELR